MEELTANNKLTTEQSQTIAQRTNKLLGMVTNSPKTKHWEKRAKTGTKKLWYREVEDIVR